MQQKDYILIAQTIRDIKARKAKGDRIVEIFGEALKKDNPSFNVERFKDYCHSKPSQTNYKL